MRDVIEVGDVTVHIIHTSVNHVDFLTNCVLGQKVETCLEILKVLRSREVSEVVGDNVVDCSPRGENQNKSISFGKKAN